MSESDSHASSQGSDRQSNPWPDYATIWRWHFYAGVFCIPFVIVLSISGTLFLFRPQIEAWQERNLDRLERPSSAVSYADQVRAVQASSGGWLSHLEVASEPGTTPGHASATRVVVESKGKRLRCYVDPGDSNVLRTIDESERVMRFIRRVHGELLLGKRGSYLVELAASWTIMLVLTGMVLWLPRPIRIAGVLYPRLSRRGKVFWKDLHSVVGFWASGLIVFLIATGLPWSTFWGDYFKTARHWTGTSVALQSWDGGHANHAVKQSGMAARDGSQSRADAGDRTTEAVRPPWQKAAVDPSQYRLDDIDTVAQYAKTLGWLPPVQVSPPSDGSAVWTIESTTANRPHRQSMQFDVNQHRVVRHKTFAEKHWVDRAVGQGIALHEGQRFVGSSFGWLNQALAVFATSSLVLLSCSGIVLWFRRRKRNAGRAQSGVGLCPPVVSSSQHDIAPSIARTSLLAVMAIGLSVYLPLFGISAVVVLMLDRFLLPLFPNVRHWLGRTNAVSIN